MLPLFEHPTRQWFDSECSKEVNGFKGPDAKDAPSLQQPLKEGQKLV
jgi:hypothetical protein